MASCTPPRTVQATNAALFLYLALDGIPECLLDHDAVEEVQMSAVLLRAQGALEMRLGDLRRQHAIEQQPLHLVRWQERCGHAAQQTLRQQQPIERFPAYEVIGLHLVERFARNRPLPHCRQKRMCPRSAALSAIHTIARTLPRRIPTQGPPRRRGARERSARQRSSP